MPQCECDNARLTFAIESPCQLSSKLAMTIADVGSFHSEQGSFREGVWQRVTTDKRVLPGAELKFLDVTLTGKCTDRSKVVGVYLCELPGDCR